MTQSSTESSKGMWIVAALVLLLIILRQDTWFWTDDSLVFGFLPIGLFWHVCISIAASLTWALACKIAWPIDEDEEAAVVASASSEETA